MLKPGIYNRYDIPLFCSFNSIKVMKRIFLLPLTAAAVWCAMPVHADEPVETDSMTPDSMKLYELQQIEVTATRVDRKTPVAYADIGREAISRRNFGSDMPTLLQMTPSVVATSDAGNGIGGTAFPSARFGCFAHQCHNQRRADERCREPLGLLVRYARHGFFGRNDPGTARCRNLDQRYGEPSAVR